MTPNEEALLLADGEAILTRRAELERAILRGHRGTRAALAVQVAQLARQRDRVRVELLRITAEADEREAGSGDDDAYDDEPAVEGFYAARERLAVRDRELMYQIEALSHRARTLPRAPTPPALVDLENARAQLETQLGQWRARCRRAGVTLDIPRFDEYAGVSPED